MKWFKHISDSLDDPFIFDLMSEFGCAGYVVFFGIIEIYSREFSRENQWKLDVSLSFLHQKLRVSPQKIKKILSKIYKWEVDINANKVVIFIPKFTELMDEWTLRKIGSQSGVTPEILRHDKDIRYKIKNKDIRKNIKKEKISDDDFLKQLKETFPWVDYELEIKKIDLWLSNNPQRKKTRRFILNWFNRKEKPLSINPQSKTQIDGGRAIKTKYDCHICKKTFTDYNDYLKHDCREEARQ